MGPALQALKAWLCGEVAVLVLGLVAVAAGAWMGWDHLFGGDQLRRDGTCVVATATEVKATAVPARIGRFAEFGYTVDGTDHARTARYQGRPMLPGQPVRICVERDDPATFTFADNEPTGDSLGRWVRWFLSPLLVIGGLVTTARILCDRDWMSGLWKPTSYRPRHGS